VGFRPDAIVSPWARDCPFYSLSDVALPLRRLHVDQSRKPRLGDGTVSGSCRLYGQVGSVDDQAVVVELLSLLAGQGGFRHRQVKIAGVVAS